jgi:hypothetical protein
LFSNRLPAIFGNSAGYAGDVLLLLSCGFQTANTQISASLPKHRHKPIIKKDNALVRTLLQFVGGSEYRRLSDADEEQVSGGEEQVLGVEKFVRVAAPELTLSESLRTVDYW